MVRPRSTIAIGRRSTPRSSLGSPARTRRSASAPPPTPGARANAGPPTSWRRAPGIAEAAGEQFVHPSTTRPCAMRPRRPCRRRSVCRPRAAAAIVACRRACRSSMCAAYGERLRRRRSREGVDVDERRHDADLLRREGGDRRLVSPVACSMQSVPASAKSWSDSSRSSARSPRPFLVGRRDRPVGTSTGQHGARSPTRDRSSPHEFDPPVAGPGSIRTCATRSPARPPTRSCGCSGEGAMAPGADDPRRSSRSSTQRRPADRASRMSSVPWS